MTVCHFVFFRFEGAPDRRVAEADLPGLHAFLRATPALRIAKVHVALPERVAGPFVNDERPPQLALQLYYDRIEHLEAPVLAGGHLQGLAATLPSLAGGRITHQAMVVRPFPVPPNDARTPTRCSYLVHYPGAAEDMNAWLRHYVTHHPQLMFDFPGIREIEVYSRLDWCDAVPWERATAMQRNKVVFDSPEALSASLVSPAIGPMRADYHSFPPFTGANVHYPMITRTEVFA